MSNVTLTCSFKLNEWRHKMKVLITGGSGFVGSFLADKLVDNQHDVTVFDVDPPKYGKVDSINYIRGDILDERAVNSAVAGQDMVFHLAGLLGTHELIPNAFQATMVNIGGALRVMEACSKHSVRLMAISKPNCWINPYTITKVAMEQYIEMYRREFELKAVIIRWFNVYGGRQPLFEEKGYRKAVPTWIVNGLRGETIEIYGNGDQTMDLIYTDDVARAALAVIDFWEKLEGGAFEIGSGEETTALELARIIQQETGGSSTITNIPMRPGEVENTRIKADISAFSSVTGWRPSTSLSVGIKETVDWYRRHLLENKR